MPSKREVQEQSKQGEPLDAPETPRVNSEVLQRHLWSAVDPLRGTLESSDCRNYVLGLLFLKRLSDRFDEECEIVNAQGGDPEDPDEHQLYVPPPARWQTLRSTAANLGEALNRATAVLEEANPELAGVLYTIDYNDHWKLGDARQRDQVLGHLVLHFSRIDLRNANLSDPEVLSRAYEHLLACFPEEAAKGGSEFYTPQPVARLMVEILQPREGMRICDPACGSGGMLIQSAQYVARQGGDPRDLSLYGQEKNLSAWATSKLNLLFSDLPDARIEKGDTLRDPRLLEDGYLMHFDIVIANPPVSLSNWGWENAGGDPRFLFGMPPKSKGDYAFLQHMIATLEPRGRMAVLIPQAALSRGGAEAKIRQGIIESDLIEAVINLPPGILPTTLVAPAILLVNRAKSANRRGKILLVDLPREAGDVQQAWQHLKSSALESIAAEVLDFRERAGRSKVVTLEEVASHNFNLKSSLYFETSLSGERLDRIAEVLQSKARSPLPHEEEGETPVVQGRDLKVRGLSLEDLARWPKAALSKPIVVREGDILLQRIGKTPKAILAGKGLAGALASDTVYVIRLREKYQKEGIYLVDFLNSQAGQKHVANSRPSAVIPTLSPRVLRGLRVPLPDPRVSGLLQRVRILEDDLYDQIQKALAIRSQLFEAQDPAVLEAELQRLSLEAELLRESVARSEDLHFQIRNFYPHMVAFGYRGLASIADLGERRQQQLIVLDALVIFLGSVGLALAASVGTPEELKANKLGRDDLLQMWGSASLGHWVSLCRGAAKVLKRNGRSPAENAFAAMWTSKLDGTLSDLVSRRNDLSHRYKKRPRRELKALLENFEERLREVFRASSFFVRHPIRLVESLDKVWKKEEFVLNTLVYSGDHPSLRREEVRYPHSLPQGHLYLQCAPNDWLSLYPLLSVEDLGGERQTFAIDRFDERRPKLSLKGLESGKEASSEHCQKVGEDLIVWLDDIFGPQEHYAAEA